MTNISEVRPRRQPESAPWPLACQEGLDPSDQIVAEECRFCSRRVVVLYRAHGAGVLAMRPDGCRNSRCGEKTGGAVLEVIAEKALARDYRRMI